MALTAYFDASGSDRNSNQDFVLAGYFMPVDNWIAFNNDWIPTLAMPPKIEYFRSTEAEFGEGQFEGLAREFRLCKLNDLAAIVEKHSPNAIWSALHWDDYDAVFSGRVPREMDDPYYFLFFSVIQRVLDFQTERGMYEKVDFTFDIENKSLMERINFFYSRVRDQLPKRLQDLIGLQPIFRDDREARPLQAADMYAWQIRRSYTVPEEERPILPKLMGSAGAANYLSRQQLKQYLDVFLKGARPIPYKTENL